MKEGAAQVDVDTISLRAVFAWLFLSQTVQHPRYVGEVEVERELGLLQAESESQNILSWMGSTRTVEFSS